ncbi:type IV toxin-antitoxin system AbiEi family antitoxin domain-containing protein [Mycobacterium sp. NPDC003449]
MTLDEVFARNGGVATTQQLLAVMSYRTLARRVRDGRVFRVVHGVYAQHPPDTSARLAALDLMTGTRVVACLQTAAELYGFNTEPDGRLHILDPGLRIRPSAGLMVHQRIGAPLRKIQGRLVTSPAWTAVELARTVRRPRALAVLDAALFSRSATVPDLRAAIDEQKGRRGIVKVRELIEHADGRAESPMESEARLVFIDRGVPLPELQYEIRDRHGKLWRVDFAWPDARVVAEYDSVEWHMGADALKHDRLKVARLQECGWMSIPLVVDDVRERPEELVARIVGHLDRSTPLAG